MSADVYRGYRFPKEVISQCLWLYFNFCVSLRNVELMMASRGVQLSYETIRRWCDKFGQSYAAKLKRRRPKVGDKWHLDEVLLKINGVQHYLWRAVDQHGTVIDILVQPKRDRLAAMRFFASFCVQLDGVPRDHHRQAPKLWDAEAIGHAQLLIDSNLAI
ncbi:MAG: IS6 family transposase [Bryobacteraceae bacterium]